MLQSLYCYHVRQQQPLPFVRRIDVIGVGPPKAVRVAVNLLRRDNTCKRSIKGKLLRAAIAPDYLKRILKS